MLSYGINDKYIFELHCEMGVSERIHWQKMTGTELEVCNVIFISISKQLIKVMKFIYPVLHLRHGD